jgi:EmrB/QacA subfamily drug resistance transporter
MELALPRLPGLEGGARVQLERPGALGSGSRRWWALAVILLAQLMIILDIVIVNVALPSAQRAFHIAPADIQWIITAYLLPFGGLLLLGGRIADYTGRRRAFLIATIGFGLASASAGAAQTEGMLFASRAVQGLFAAVMAPAALSMLTLGFPSGRDRNIAFSLYTIVGATGGAAGLILGGVLTRYLSWRWCLLINCPISILVLVGAGLLPESRAATVRHYDAAGAGFATLGLLGLIYGISDAATHGWGSARTLGPMICGLSLLVAFVVWEDRSADPLLPLGLLRSRARAAGVLGIAGAVAAPAGLVLLVLVFLQGPQRESALTSGLSFIPAPLCGMLGAALTLRLLGRIPPRPLLSGMFVLEAFAFLLATRTRIGGGYLATLAPAIAVFGVGATSMFLVANTLALADTPPDDAGVLSATINAIQQISTALGASILATVAASSETRYVDAHGPRSLPVAVVHGDHVAFLVGAAVVVSLGVACVILAPSGRRVEAKQPTTHAAGARAIAWAITIGVGLAMVTRSQRAR